MRSLLKVPCPHLSLIPLAALVLVACDSPGGGTACVEMPDAAPCFVPDTFAPDTTGDTSSPDSTSNDSTAELPDLGDVATPPECIGDLSRCNDNLVEQCIDGRFVATLQCTGASVCDNGACVERDCSANETRCADGTRQRCIDGDWSSIETCPFGCLGTECKPYGDGTCEDAVACAEREGCLSDGHILEECADNCARASVPAAQEPFHMLLACANECGNDLQCVLDWCIDDQVSCFFPKHGSGSCASLHGCVSRCTTQECADTCYDAATIDAQRAFLKWTTCDQLCDGFGCGECNTYFDECRAM